MLNSYPSWMSVVWPQVFLFWSREQQNRSKGSSTSNIFSNYCSNRNRDILHFLLKDRNNIHSFGHICFLLEERKTETREWSIAKSRGNRLRKLTWNWFWFVQRDCQYSRDQVLILLWIVKKSITMIEWCRSYSSLLLFENSIWQPWSFTF